MISICLLEFACTIRTEKEGFHFCEVYKESNQLTIILRERSFRPHELSFMNRWGMKQHQGWKKKIKIHLIYWSFNLNGLAIRLNLAWHQNDQNCEVSSFRQYRTYVHCEALLRRSRACSLQRKVSPCWSCGCFTSPKCALLLPQFVPKFACHVVQTNGGIPFCVFLSRSK